MSQRAVLYACVEAKSQGGDTHIAYAASNERSLNANLISNLSSSSNEHPIFPGFSMRFADYVVEINLRIHRMVSVYGKR